MLHYSNKKGDTMERIASFTVNHNVLKKGMYTSRIDDDIVTYDIRMARPNSDEYLENDAIHTFEHLFATYARNTEQADQVIYIGPMGCRTGFYLLVRDTITPTMAIKLVKNSCEFIAKYTGEIPGSTPKECGNAAEHNLEKAKALGQMMKEVLANWSVPQLVYPD